MLPVRVAKDEGERIRDKIRSDEYSRNSDSYFILPSFTFNLLSCYAPSSTQVTNGSPLATSRTPASSTVSRMPSDVPATMPLPSGVGQRCMTPPFRLSTTVSQVAPLSPLRRIADLAPSSRIHKLGRPRAAPT